MSKQIVPVVYVVAWSPRGPSKIGVAVDPIARLYGLQTGCPFRLRIYFAAHVDAGREFDVESQVLGALDGLRMVGEWIRIGPRLLAEHLRIEATAMNVEWCKWQPQKWEIERRQSIIAANRRPPSPQRLRAAYDELRRNHKDFGG